MNKKTPDMQKIIDELTSYKGIPVEDIPDIALYMDQVTTFMDKKLASFKRHDDDKILTKTMINNYSKANLIFPPINKKYEKEHIMILTLIYHMKQIISANDIAKLLNPIISYVDTSDEKKKTASELYKVFTEMESQQLILFGQSVDDIINNLYENSEIDGISDSAFHILLILTLVIQAERRKNLAERLIDVFYAKPEPEKKKEEEKSRDKTKNKPPKK